MNRHHEKITGGGDMHDKFFGISAKLKKEVANLETMLQEVFL